MKRLQVMKPKVWPCSEYPEGNEDEVFELKRLRDSGQDDEGLSV